MPSKFEVNLYLNIKTALNRDEARTIFEEAWQRMTGYAWLRLVRKMRLHNTCAAYRSTTPSGRVDIYYVLRRN